MAAKWRQADDLLDCTIKCRSQQHGQQVASLIINCDPGNSDQLKSYIRCLCHNFHLVADEFGRNALHVSASCGHDDLIEWLIHNCHVDVNIKDLESGWTALHRSLFYKQIAAARILLSNEADLYSEDFNGSTPLDMILYDRLPFIEYKKADMCDVYVWGVNANYNLGLGNEQSRKMPELLTCFSQEKIYIKQVLFRKFHSTFLSSVGKVYTCGHGHGGRLCQHNQEMSVTPQLVHGLNNMKCSQIAAGLDHMIFLMEGCNQIMSVGSNAYHQLGHTPPPDKLESPKLISLKHLKLDKLVIIGVDAARYHSVFYTKNSLFTFGLNAGQLGHIKDNTNNTQTLPRHVSVLNQKDFKIEHVAVSDGATICTTDKGDIYVLHEYQCRKIASNQLGLLKVSVIGGKLCESCGVQNINLNGQNELQIALLMKTGHISIWRDSDSTTSRCLLKYSRNFIAKDIHLGGGIMSVVTSEGEALTGRICYRKASVSPSDTTQTHDKASTRTDDATMNRMNRKTSLKSSNAPIETGQIKHDKMLTNTVTNRIGVDMIDRKSGHGNVTTHGKIGKAAPQLVKTFVQFLNPDECHIIRLKRIPNIHRAVAIISDNKSSNFAVLQSIPKLGMFETVEPLPSKMTSNFKDLLNDFEENNSYSDFVINYGNKKRYFVHKFILASRSEFFAKIFRTDVEKDCLDIDIKSVSQEILNQIVNFIYTNTNDFMENGFQLKLPQTTEKQNKSSEKGNKKKAPVDSLREVFKRFGLNSLASNMTNNNIKISTGNKIKIMNIDDLPKFGFDRKKFENFHDVVLISADDIEFKCHRIILATRLEYFKCMFSFDWVETRNTKSLKLPMPASLLSVLIDFLYTDEAHTISIIDDIDFICKIFIMSDQFLIPEIKIKCEASLVNLLTLKNSCELLELSYIYNACELRRCCQNFISINLPTLIESSYMNVLSTEAINDLTIYYKNLPYMLGLSRVIKLQPDKKLEKEMENIRTQLIENFQDSEDSNESFEVLRKLDTNENKILQRPKYSRKRTVSTRSHSESAVESEATVVAQTDVNVTTVREESQMPTIKPVEPIYESRKLENNEKITWGLNLSIKSPPSYSLRDIMLEQERSSCVAKLKHSSPINIVRQIAKEFSPPNSGSSRSPSNPWNIPATPPPSYNDSLNISSNALHSVSINAIIEKEEEGLRNRTKYAAKSLHVISKEDKAIEELLFLYESNYGHDEQISVLRVLPDNVAGPVWKRH